MSEGVMRVLYVTERRLKNAGWLSVIVYAAVLFWSYYTARASVIPLELWSPIFLLAFLPKALLDAIIVMLRWAYGYAKGNCGAAPWAWLDTLAASVSIVAVLLALIALPLCPMFDLEFVLTRFGSYLAAVAVAMLLTASWLLRLAWRDYLMWQAYVTDEGMPVGFQTYAALMYTHMMMEAR